MSTLKVVIICSHIATYVNRTTGLNPHKIVYDFKPRQHIDIIPIVGYHKVSASASSFASHG